MAKLSTKPSKASKDIVRYGTLIIRVQNMANSQTYVDRLCVTGLLLDRQSLLDNRRLDQTNDPRQTYRDNYGV